MRVICLPSPPHTCSHLYFKVAPVVQEPVILDDSVTIHLHPPLPHTCSYLYGQVAPIIEEPVLLDGTVPARLHHQVTLLSGLIQLHALGDDVLVAPLEPRERGG